MQLQYGLNTSLTEYKWAALRFSCLSVEERSGEEERSPMITVSRGSFCIEVLDVSLVESITL
jgi:hypothetical protein